MFCYVNSLKDGNTKLFWDKFVGRIPGTNNFGVGRAGWTHMGPNTNVNYDVLNTTLVASDIEDWRPDGAGQKTMVNVNTWASIPYNWPGASNFAQKAESQWYLYWMQNFPGQGNRIPYGDQFEMTNWWELVADWDKSIKNGVGLYRATTTPYETWHANRFTTDCLATGSTAATEDFDGDGLLNLHEYAFGKDPRSAEVSSILSDVSNGNIQISLPCDASRTDITYTVQASSTLAEGSWIDIAKSIGGTAMLPINSLSTVSDTGLGLRTVTVTESRNILSAGGKRFLRVKISSH